ncbi:MAG: hypothetical protein K6G24_03420 [Lachnospiraceae bacterium]|nr:hypothetical protein [Lachnospiraceae bacterium]
MASYCYKCMSLLNGANEICPYCGDRLNDSIPLHHLLPGTLLRDKYLVGKSDVYVSKVDIFNGYSKSEKSYVNNGKLISARLHYDGGFIDLNCAELNWKDINGDGNMILNILMGGNEIWRTMEQRIRD